MSSGALPAVLVVLLALPAAAEWTAIREENGVTVHAAREPGRLYPPLLAVTQIAASPREVLSWILDTSTHASWMYACAEARVLRKEGDIFYSYSRLDLPWPFDDRDVVVRVETHALRDGAVQIDLRTTDNADVARVASVVRMPLLVGQYDLTPVAAGRTRVTYRVEWDPGGSLPRWIVERVSRDMPYFTLVDLRRSVEADGGRSGPNGPR